MISTQTQPTKLTFDVVKIRKDFPILSQQVHGKALVYLDNAATSQKPQVVIDSLVRYYTEFNSNVHRGVHLLSEQATKAYEESRVKVQRYINAKRSEEIIFTRGTTEGINLVAQSFGRANIHEGDEIIISGMEHHSNIVPWQMLCAEKKATLRVIPIDDNGEIILDEYVKLFNDKTRFAAYTHVSNALGTVNPIKHMIETAHAHNVPVLIDGAQAIPHLRIDVQELDYDFYVFSSHKMFGPTGIGVVYGKKSLLETMPPYQGGGDMIKSVTFEKTIYNDLPYKFEAGTPNIADTIAFGVAIDYLNSLDFEAIHDYEQELLEYATEKLSTVNGLTIIGTAREKAGVVSFTLDGIHPHDIGTILDTEGIAIRTGHHCAQLVMQRFCVPATARASFAFYNTKNEIDALVDGINKVKEIFS
ncbi:MAG: cysteine desulfurase [Ignavibacteriae bacterium]|nr:cysteine desulfurase [Ignavibacteriota bacterium]